MNTTERKRFFCIRGYMKSGTNWICRLLNLHPDIFCTGEYHWEEYFNAYQKSMDTYVYLNRSEQKSPVIRTNMERMIRRSMIEMSPPSALVIGDRTPHTIAPIAVRNAHQLVIVRDLRDVVVSRMYHYFNAKKMFGFFRRFPEMVELKEEFENDPWLFHKNPRRLLSNEYFVRQTARQWREYLEEDRETAKQNPKLPVKIFRYESVHKDIETELAEMFKFLKLDPEAAEAIPETLTPGIKTESPNKFYRKGQVGDWKNYMTERAKRWINDEAGEELLNQGYVDSLDWEVGELVRRSVA